MWFKRKLRNWALSFEDERDNQYQIGSDRVSAVRTIDSNGLNLNIYKASGGTVIETNLYDRHANRHRPGLYVITDDKDLGYELNKIITIENLRS